MFFGFRVLLRQVYDAIVVARTVAWVPHEVRSRSQGIFVYTGEADIYCKHVPWRKAEFGGSKSLLIGGLSTEPEGWNPGWSPGGCSKIPASLTLIIFVSLALGLGRKQSQSQQSFAFSLWHPSPERGVG